MRGYFELETEVAKAALRVGVGPVPRPPFWSGFRVVPDAMEFWTRDPARLHERERFERDGDRWVRRLLYP